jgi:heme-degrading monooxygenase HmoA
MKPHHLAQVNIGRIVGPLDSEVMAEFVAQLDEINELAERSPGFVWRLKDATGVQAYDDPLILVNMSVWESVDALRQYVYKSAHAAVLRDRVKWFEKPAQAHMAMWWIEAGHVPSVQEARERLEHRQKWGDSPTAFSFGKYFPAPAPSPRKLEVGL